MCILFVECLKKLMVYIFNMTNIFNNGKHFQKTAYDTATLWVLLMVQLFDFQLNKF